MRQPEDTRGILQPGEALRNLAIQRDPLPADLAPYTDWMWGVRWDLPPDVEHHQETLPAPCVHLVFEDGGFFVHGPGTKRFEVTLSGRGWVRGIRFRPAGFRAFFARPIHELTDRVVAADTLLEAAPPAPQTFDDAGDALVAYLRANGPRPDPKIEQLNELVAAAQREGSTLRVEGLARLAGVSTRSLHRLFADYVGVSSKWIVRRARVHDAAERVARGERIDWAQLASELGYSDQAHLIRDFRAQVGFTPSQYARRCQTDP
ncbi:MAG TPA: helix-turn-helix domain-containing protein [Polyangiales bacterium]|nr:helix-turn-helix domain-containing protein [Polyangiales bacterium]